MKSLKIIFTATICVCAGMAIGLIKGYYYGHHEGYVSCELNHIENPKIIECNPMLCRVQEEINAIGR